MNRLVFAALSLLALTLHAAEPIAAPQERPVLDVVFVLDTTSSMGGLIEGAKQKIWSIASRLASGTPTPRVRVGLVAYRDVGDAYVTQVVPLSEDLDAIYAKLRGFRAEGGGDGPEAVQDGLHDAVTKMKWSDSKRVAKMIFVVGDAPAHEQDKPKLLAAAKTAISQGIVVNTIRCGADEVAAGQFAQVAKLADGHFDSIQQSGGVVAVATPFDADLARLNGEMMDTALYGGARPAKAAAEVRRVETKALAAPAAADRMSYFSKGMAGAGASASAGASAVGAVDLTATPEKAAALKDDELPTELQKLSPEERVSYAKAKQQKRAELSKQIAELSKKRDEYVAKAAKADKSSFDARVFEAVAETAKRADVAY
ncbi:MAG: VWA domain-containing protein [Myxococcaceae bacterium]|nr:VWA domain-containing protein [Myxococcaceae bacterium]